MRRLRIHGDNIIECERTLMMIVDAFAAQYTILKSELYLPIYRVDVAPAVSLQIELLSGHGRWGVDINNLLMNSGGILREGADSYLTEVCNGVEQILLAIEYCSALPAGNNAWQRNGRAYSCVLSGIPYLYYAEIGGVELNEDRTVKAPRYPNPIVPYSYLSATKRMSSFCLPVYKPHPSITDDIFTKFKNVFGIQDGLAILKGIIMGLDISGIIDALADKSLKMATVLADGRRAYDTLRGEEWSDMAESLDPISWIKENKQSLLWSKRAAAKVNVSNSFRSLLKSTVDLGCLTIGAKDVPICLIPHDKILGFKKILNELYPDLKLNIDDQEDLIVIWVTGFKPQGDDSRPDRGLVPLARMVAGEDANMLSIVYGPAKSRTWALAASSLDQLAEDNGLWQSIINISNGLLIDSATSSNVIYSNLSNSVAENIKPVEFPYVSPTVNFGEHDTDCAIHQIFAHKESMRIYESLCNPPGGDWSGVSIINSIDNNAYRWTSLPRVSNIGGKRPDHVIQIIGEDEDVFLSIESKQLARNLENNVGANLKSYLVDLFSSNPTAMCMPNQEYRLYSGGQLQLRSIRYISVGAFIYIDENNLRTNLSRVNLDVVFAFEFSATTKLHMYAVAECQFLYGIIEQIQRDMGGFEIEIH